MIVSGGARPQPGTLNQLFFNAVEKFDKPDALMSKTEPGTQVPKGESDGGPVASDSSYARISHRRLAERVRRLALALRDSGIKRGDRVAILSTNRPEWAICDYACLTAGFATVPIYPSLPADQILYLLKDSGATAIFASNAMQVAKVAQIRASLPDMRMVITFAELSVAGSDATMLELEARGEELENAESLASYRAGALEVRPDDLATIVYTSGTTGNPKGVMLTHDNLFSNVSGAQEVLQFKNDISLSILPLSHVFERMAGHFLMFSAGATIAYAESIDTVAPNMLEVRPTFVLAVPRLYEKMYARVLDKARSAGGIKLKIFNWARAVSDRWADVKLAGQVPKGLLAFQYRIADKLVFSEVRKRTGGRLRFFVSGSAPLSPEINKFFYASGLPILEGYGLTETSPVLTVNTPREFRIGSVGKPIVGVDITIAPDGEILARGPGIMKGYWNNPVATDEAIDTDGWFHTGDIGELRDGFLAITDRKKDIIVTAGGKKIAPQPIENTTKLNEFVTEAVMIGDKRKYAVMLIIPSFERLEKWAAEQSLKWNGRAELIALPAVREKMEKEVLGAHAGLASFERPKKIALLEHEFSFDKGEITPSLKVKRKVVDANYKSVIDGLYAE